MDYGNVAVRSHLNIPYVFHFVFYRVPRLKTKKMKRTLILLLVLIIHSGIGYNVSESSLLSKSNLQQKGIVDWIIGLVGKPPTTLTPIEDPPENCPSCR